MPTVSGAMPQPIISEGKGTPSGSGPIKTQPSEAHDHSHCKWIGRYIVPIEGEGGGQGQEEKPSAGSAEVQRAGTKL